MYSLDGYASMIADRVRVDAYADAMREAIRPGAVVAEIGTGPGIFAVLACQLGASHVYAIESDDIIQVAREIAAANHCTGKIEFIEDTSTSVILRTSVDVLVSDLRGVLPIFQHHIPSIADARRRFLKPGGKLIPRRDEVWVAVVEAPGPYGKVVDSWENNALGQDLSPARRMAVNNQQKVRVSPEQLLTEPQLWAKLDYATVEEPGVCGSVEFAVEKAGTGHGIIAWFDTELADGVGFSNAPEAPETIYGCLLFPWTQPVPLTTGQIIRLDLEAKLIEKDYMWRWITNVHQLSRSAITFDQSSLGASVLSTAKLRKVASDYVPVLSKEGRVHYRALELMDGKNSLEAVARRLAVDFPKRFPALQEALRYASKLSQEHS